MTIYYANVTFPTNALALPSLQRWYRKVDSGCIMERDDLVTVAEPHALFGRMPVTATLDLFQVPYDHFHKNEERQNIYTEQVRFVDGQRKVTIVRATDTARQQFAQELLGLLDAGEMDKLRETLVHTVEKTRAPEIADIARAWDPETQFVLYSREQAIENGGAGFWSNTQGWVTLNEASIYDEIGKLLFPVMEDTEWQTLADALAVYAEHQIETDEP